MFKNVLACTLISNEELQQAKDALCRFMFEATTGKWLIQCWLSI